MTPFATRPPPSHEAEGGKPSSPQPRAGLDAPSAVRPPPSSTAAPSPPPPGLATSTSTASSPTDNNATSAPHLAPAPQLGGIRGSAGPRPEGLEVPLPAGPAAPPAALTTPSTSTSSKMLFADLYKGQRSPIVSKLRRAAPQPLVIETPDYDADLVSKDKAKQKEAVRRYLSDKIRNDWEFQWPPVATSKPAAVQEADRGALVAEEPDTASENDGDSEDGHGAEDDDDDAASVYSTVSEDIAHYRPRLEWTSDLSDDEAPISPSPFRFDSPDSVGTAVKASVLAKRARRRKAVRDEIQWNEGLACFEARRNAWTGARTVRVRPKPVSPSTPFSTLSPKRLFSRNSMPTSPVNTIPTSPLSPTQSHAQRPSADGSTAAASSDGSEPSKESSGLNGMSKQLTKDSTRSTGSQHHHSYSGSSILLPVETLIPIPPPLLPPNNSMRASITPAMYLSIYDKVVANVLTPSCPINLSDMLRACVAGWKRDGEWPPKSSALDHAGIIAVRRKKKAADGAQANGNVARRMSLGFLGRGGKSPEKENKMEDAAATSKGIRRSIQRVFGLGHGHSASFSGSPTAAVGGVAKDGHL